MNNYRFLDENKLWESTWLVVRVVEIIQNSCSQSQNLYILLSSLLEKIQDTEKRFSANAKFTIVSCIAQLIIQGGAVITLANLELLEVFVTQLQSNLDTTDAKLQKDYQHLLISSTGTFKFYLLDRKSCSFIIISKST